MTKEEKKYIALGKTFRSAREGLKLTQTEVAEKSGVSVNYYARIERGEENPTFDILQKVMKVLHIKSLDIL